MERILSRFPGTGSQPFSKRYVITTILNLANESQDPIYRRQSSHPRQTRQSLPAPTASPPRATARTSPITRPTPAPGNQSLEHRPPHPADIIPGRQTRRHHRRLRIRRPLVHHQLNQTTKIPLRLVRMDDLKPKGGGFSIPRALAPAAVEMTICRRGEHQSISRSIWPHANPSTAKREKAALAPDEGVLRKGLSLMRT